MEKAGLFSTAIICVNAKDDFSLEIIKQVHAFLDESNCTYRAVEPTTILVAIPRTENKTKWHSEVKKLHSCLCVLLKNESAGQSLKIGEALFSGTTDFPMGRLVNDAMYEAMGIDGDD